MAQRVGTDALGDPGSSGDATHDPSGGVAFEPAQVDERIGDEGLEDEEPARPAANPFPAASAAPR